MLATDTTVVSQKRSAPEDEHLIRRLPEHDPSDSFVSIVTFHKQVMGWNAYVPIPSRSLAKRPAKTGRDVLDRGRSPGEESVPRPGWLRVR